VDTTVATVSEDDAEVEEGDLEIGGDLGADEDEPEEDTNLFYKGQRLIPNHVFESPSLPIRQQVLASKTAMPNSIFAFATIVANKYGHSPHFIE